MQHLAALNCTHCNVVLESHIIEQQARTQITPLDVIHATTPSALCLATQHLEESHNTSDEIETDKIVEVTGLTGWPISYTVYA